MAFLGWQTGGCTSGKLSTLRISSFRICDEGNFYSSMQAVDYVLTKFFSIAEIEGSAHVVTILELIVLSDWKVRCSKIDPEFWNPGKRSVDAMVRLRGF